MSDDHFKLELQLYLEIPTVWKVSKYGVFSGPYIPVIGLNISQP